MDYDQLFKLFLTLGGSVNVGILLKLIYNYLRKDTPLEESEEYDNEGRILKRHRKNR